ncbi:MAG: sugar-binding protein [Chthonomonadales bacterium]
MLLPIRHPDRRSTATEETRPIAQPKRTGVICRLRKQGVGFGVLRFIACLTCFGWRHSWAQETTNSVLRIVPAPGVVRVDGRLEDWDLSGSILCCYDWARLHATHSVRAAAMYDSRFLYLAFRFKDRTPLINHIDPRQDPDGGWKADAVQMRIETDRVAHVTAWYYTDGRRAAMHIHYGFWDTGNPASQADLINPLSAGAQEAFRKDPTGYTQELAVPWRLITRSGRCPAVRSRFRMGLEFFWGSPKANDFPEHRYADLVNPNRPQRSFFWQNPDAWGTAVLEARGHLRPLPAPNGVSVAARYAELAYRTSGVVAIRYRLPESGFVTLVIESPDGRRVRNLIGEYPRTAGVHTEYWDGTDDAGHLVPAGRYVVRGLFHKRLGLRYAFAYGNPGDPPYDNSTGTGGWLSNHAPPMDVCAGKGRVYLSAAFAEGATAVMAASYSGKRLWGIGNINGGMMAEDGRYLYVLVGGPTTAWGGPPQDEVALLRIDASNGRYAPWPDGKAMHTIASIPPASVPFGDQLGSPPGRPAGWYQPNRPEGELVARHGFTADWCQRQTMGIAVCGGRIYASLYYQDDVIQVDAGTGTPMAHIPLRRPAGLACGPHGVVYAISGNRIVVLQNGAWRPVVTQGLEAPVGLAVDADGEIYVSDWGSRMCVEVFSPDGHFSRTIGRLGGRPLEGRYDPTGMFRPWGVAVDASGRLWVAECDNSPRRLSVWDAHTGRFLREFCGSTWYASVGARVDVSRPNRAFVMGNVCDLDWKRGLWRVAGTLFRPQHPDELFDASTEGLVLEVRRRQGRDYLIASNSSLLIIAKLHDYSAKPVAAMGTIYGLYQPGHLWPDLIIRHLASSPAELEKLKQRHPKAFDGSGAAYPDVAFMLGETNVHQYFVWTDRNEDGRIQDDEIRFYSREELRGMKLAGDWRFGIGPDFTVYLPGSNSSGTPRQQLWKLRPRSWSASGVPDYRIADATKIADVPVLGFVDSSIWTDAYGDTLIGQNPLMMFSPAGKLLWTYPNAWPGVHGSHTAPASRRGRVIGPLWVLGSVHLRRVGSIFCMGANLGERYLFTRDGLFVGSLFADCRSAPDALPDIPVRGMDISACTAGGESFGGEFFENPLDHKIYLGGPVGSCREASVVAEVTGLESIRRLPSTHLSFTAADRARARVFLQRRANVEAPLKVLAIAPLDHPPASRVPEWSEFPLSDDRRVARWSFDPFHTVGAATWTFDGQWLYLAVAAIRDDTPMINDGRDVQTLFKTGDAVEFEIRTTPNNDSPSVLPGDLRVVISVFQGKPIAVLYRYRVPGTRTPVRFRSPVGAYPVDEVRVLQNASVLIERGAGEYSVRAAIPLADLGFRPEKGNTYRGDFGVVYSDRAGKSDELRMYWANPANAMVNDLFSEVQIDPRAWARFVVE